MVVRALFNGDPEPHGYSYVIRDVTEQHRIDEELRRLEAVVRSSRDAIVSTTPETQIVTSWNDGAERLFGYAAREMIGRPFTTLVPEEHHAAHVEALERAAAGDGLDERDLQVIRKNGSRIDVALTISPIRDSGGAVVGLASIAHDVGDRKIEKESMVRALGTYLDSEVAEHILREGRGLCAREVDVTTMFIDIRGFTSFAERFDPREVVQTLNCLFELAVPVISERGGYVDKFVGDGLLAVFGAPAPCRDHADRAVEAAFAIAQQASDWFKGDLEIGIGIDSGSVVAGNVGGGGRLDFTVIGDAVNTAARIEGRHARYRRSDPDQRSDPAAAVARRGESHEAPARDREGQAATGGRVRAAAAGRRSGRQLSQCLRSDSCANGRRETRRAPRPTTIGSSHWRTGRSRWWTGLPVAPERARVATTRCHPRVYRRTMTRPAASSTRPAARARKAPSSGAVSVSLVSSTLLPSSSV